MWLRGILSRRKCLLCRMCFDVLDFVDGEFVDGFKKMGRFARMHED